MSAALQLPVIWGSSAAPTTWHGDERSEEEKSGFQRDEKLAASAPGGIAATSIGFYRRHTEKLLKRYLYASMQVGRSPSILGESVGRGWASSRPLRTFEDAVIFVLDIEKCLEQLSSLDRLMLGRLVLQEYTQEEAAPLLGMSTRSVAHRFPLALDQLTGRLLEAGLLVIPH